MAKTPINSGDIYKALRAPELLQSATITRSRALKPLFKQHCTYLQMADAGYRDVTGKNLSPAVSGTIGTGIAAKGRHLNFTGAGGLYAVNTNTRWREINGSPSTMSALVVCRADNTSTRTTIIGDWNSAGEAQSLVVEFTGWDQPSTSLGCQVGSTRPYAVAKSATNNGQWYTLALSWDGLTVRTWVDGVAGGTMNNSTHHALGNNRPAIGQAGAYTPLRANGDVALFALFNERLPDQVMRDLSRNPNLLFEPANDAHIPFGTAAAPTTTGTFRLPKDFAKALTAPELLVPGRVPDARRIKPRTDGHWSANGLVGALVPINGVLHDVVNGHYASHTGGRRYQDGAFIPSYNGATGSVVPRSGGWDLDHPNGFTLVAVFDHDTAQGFGHIAGKVAGGFSGNAGWELRLGGLTSTAVNANYISSNGASVYQAFGGTTDHYTAGTSGNFLAVTRIGNNIGTAPAIYTNDGSISVTTIFGPGGSAAQPATANNLTVGDRQDSVTSLDGAVKMVLAFNRPLSTVEIEQLQDHNFLWAQPANDAYIPFGTAAAPPSSTIPIFMHHYRQMRAR